jgi:hypothetical protein
MTGREEPPLSLFNYESDTLFGRRLSIWCASWSDDVDHQTASVLDGPPDADVVIGVYSNALLDRLKSLGVSLPSHESS